jgi:hypothetical protein
MAAISKRCENDHRSGKQNDDGELDPGHWGTSLSSIKTTASRAFRQLNLQ